MLFSADQQNTEEVTWEELEIGDIIWLQKDQICPADIVLLDSNKIKDNCAICIIDSYLVDGKVDYITKNASSLTKILNKNHPFKQHFINYRNILTGKIFYEAPNNKVNSFSGLFKLTKDPQPEQLSIENFIHRGCRIKTDWIFGLVVYVGNDCKIYKNPYQNIKQMNLQQIVDYSTHVLTVMILVFSIISYIVLQSKKNEIQFLIDMDPYNGNFLKMFTYSIVYSCIVPIGIQAILDLVILYQKFYIEQQLQREFNDSYFKFNNPDTLPNLANIDYVFIDNSLVKGNYTVNTITINKYCYNFDQDFMKKYVMPWNQAKNDEIDKPSKNTITEESMEEQDSDPEFDTQNNKSLEKVRSKKEMLLEDDNIKFAVPKQNVQTIGTPLLRRGSGQTSTIQNEFQYKFIKENSVRPLGQEDFVKKMKQLTDSFNYNNQQGSLLSNNQCEKIEDINLYFLMLSMTLCHEGHVKIIDVLQNILKFECKSRLDECCLCFCDKLGFSYYTQPKYKIEDDKTIRIRSHNVIYKVMGITSQNIRNKISLILGGFILQNKEEESYIVCKGEYQDIRLNLNVNQNELDLLDTYNNQIKAMGQIPIIYCYRQLTQGEFIEYMKFKKGMNNETETKIENYENNLQILGIVGIKDNIKKGAEEIIELFDQINAKTWIFTGDTLNMTSSLASTLGIMNKIKKQSLNQSFSHHMFHQNSITLNTQASQFTDDHFSFQKNDQIKPKQEEPKQFHISSLQEDKLSIEIKTILLTLKSILVKVRNNQLQKDIVQQPRSADKQDPEQFFNNGNSSVPKNIKMNQSTSNFKPKDGDLIMQSGIQIMEKSEFKKTESIQLQQQKDLQKDEVIDNNKKLNEKEPLTEQKSTQLTKEQLRDLNIQLLISGESFEKISNSDKLINNFTFFLWFCKSVIGYEFNRKQKFKIANLVKTKFINYPKICTISNSFNDLYLMNVSDVSIEIVKKQQTENNQKKLPPSERNRSIQINTNYGDILLENMYQLKNLILFQSIQTYTNLETIIELYFTSTILLGMPIFFFNWFSSFMGTSLHDTFLVFTYISILNTINFFLCGNLRPYDQQTLEKYPSLYLSCEQNLKIIIKKLGLMFTKAGLTASLIFYFSIYIVSRSHDDEGQSADLQTMSLVIWYSISIGLNLKMFILLLKSKRYKSAFSGLFIFITVLCVFMYIFHINSNVFWSYWEITKQISKKLHIVFCIIFNIVFLLAEDIFVDLIKDYILIKSPYKKYSVYNTKQTNYLRGIVNNDILHHILSNKIMDYNNLIKKIFQDSSNIDKNIQDLINAAESSDQGRLNFLTLDINIVQLQAKFRQTFRQESINTFRIVSILLFILLIIYSLAKYFIDGKSNELLIKFLIIIGWLFFILIQYSGLYIRSFYKFALILICIVIGIITAIVWYSIIILNQIQIKNLMEYTMLSLIIVIALTINFNFQFVKIVILNFLYLLQAVGIFFYYQFQYDNMEHEDEEVYFPNTFYFQLCFIFLLVFIYITRIQKLHTSTKEKKQNYLASEQLIQDQAYNNDILSILVPPFVQKKLALGEKSMQQDQEDVAILFADICDFDEVLEELQTGIVPLLDRLFKQFDNCCEEFGVQKVETVGKTYMAATGITECEQELQEKLQNKEKSGRLIEMAFKMKKIIEEDFKMHIKVGIHKGQVIAGVIGYHKPQFSLIGDNVNRTSRVCSTGEKGSITISEDVKKKLIQNQSWEFTQKQVFMKGIGNVNVYEVNIRKDGKKLMYFQENLAKNKNFCKQIQEEVKNNNVFKDNNKFEVLKQKMNNTDNGNSLQVDQSKSQGIGKTTEIHREDQQIIIQIKNNFFLTLKNAQKQFEQFVLSQQKNGYKIQLIQLSIIYAFHGVITIVVRKEYSSIYIIIGAQITYSLICIALSLVTTIKTPLIKPMLFIIMIIGLIPNLINIFLTDSHLLQNVEVMKNFILLFLFQDLNLFTMISTIFYVILNIMCSNIPFAYFSFQKQSFSKQYVAILTLELFYYCLYLFKQHQINKQQILLYNIIQYNDHQKKIIDEVVSQLLPQHVLHQMDSLGDFSQNMKADRFNNVSILFADISGFTAFSKRVESPLIVLEMLRSLFEAFDKLCLEHNVFKLYTIGDCYVVLSFINANKREDTPEYFMNECINTTEMGLQMLLRIQQVREVSDFKEIKMRIGIHTGGMIGGIIGTKIVRYDIYGPDVLIANKMESNGLVDRLMVSETSYHLLSHSHMYECKYYKDVEIKLQNRMIKCYLIEKTELEEDEMQSQHYM